MNYEQAMEYIHAVQWAGHKPGLTRTRTLLAALGDPHKQLRFVHVAGTNGKGSTAAMMASCLQAAGYRPEILKLRTISPVDWASIEASARKTRRVFVLEETSDRECLADEIFAHLIEAGIPAVCRKRNLGRRFVPHGAPAALLAAAGLDADSITTMMQEELSR